MSLLGKDTFFSGTFSMAGRDSAEKYNIVAEAKKVDEKSKNKVFKNFFSPDLEWENKRDDIDNENIEKECNIDINDIKNNIKFSLDYIRKNQTQPIKKPNNKKTNLKLAKNKYNLKNIKSPQKKLFKKIFQSFKYKYHNIHLAKLARYKKEGIIQKMNVQQEPIYNPKMSYIYQKLSIGPPWSKLSGRQKNLFDQENYITNLSYNENYSSIKDVKGFIDMAKQTQRNGFPKNGDIRQRCEKKFVPLNYKIINKKKDDIPKFYKTATIHRDNPFKNNNILSYDQNNNEEIIISPFSENNTTRKTRNKNKYKTMNIDKRNIKENKFGFTHRSQSVPDFNSYLSREQLDKLFKKKDRITNGVLFPNYKSIEGGVKMMVIYSKGSNNKVKNNPKEFKGMNSDEVYNANETFEKIYGNKIRAVPLFQKMTPRPDNNDLPVFLNGLTNRMSYYFSTGKSLKMNSYSNSKLYNLCNELNGEKNKYKNSYLNAVRKSLAFDSNNNYDKNKINKELEIKSKKFNELISNNNL